MEIRRNETNLHALLDENIPAYSFEKDGQKYIAAIFPCSADEYLASEYRRAGVSADDIEGADIYLAIPHKDCTRIAQSDFSSDCTMRTTQGLMPC